MKMVAVTDLRQTDVEFQTNLYVDPNPTRRGLHLSRRHWVESALVLNLPKQASAMEVGIGCGIFTRYLAALGADVTAVDINPSFLLSISQVEGVTPILADATIELPTKHQDLILCTEVLEHVPAERSLAMLATLHSALKPDGCLILTTPQRFSIVEIMARLLRFGPLLALAQRIYGTADELGHINLLTAAQLGKQLRATGFEIHLERRFGLYLPLIAEFGGRSAWIFQGYIERLIHRIPFLRASLWTQAYILKKSRPHEDNSNARSSKENFKVSNSLEVRGLIPSHSKEAVAGT